MIVVYNTLRRQKEEFVPREPGKVSMYVCGVTPYDSLHIGHLRTFLTYDMIRRFLDASGYEVLHVQNVTDIDDKIIDRAKQVGIAPAFLASKFMEEALQDCDNAGLLRAHHYPCVTQHIREILEMVECLVAKGFAYVRNGNVYFSVSRFPDYGKLSHQNIEEMQSSGRIEVDENKEDPLDFALWKSAKPDEPSWPSPWGPGRPGWHIECSAMSLKYLQDGFDIHGGAVELQFPHHENELAQSEAYTGGSPFVRYWLHGGVVFVDGKKMAKSLGNFITVRDILKETRPEALRMMFLMNHYRSPFDYSADRLAEAKASWERMSQGLRILRQKVGGYPQAQRGEKRDEATGPLTLSARTCQQRFTEAMEDDFNTPVALASLFELVSESHRFFAATPSSPETSAQAAVALQVLERALSTLGFVPFDADTHNMGALSSALIDLLIETRQTARSQKLFAMADAIRDRLHELGIVLEDHSNGTTWRRKM